jgi:hypothetical protein
MGLDPCLPVVAWCLESWLVAVVPAVAWFLELWLVAVKPAAVLEALELLLE